MCRKKLLRVCVTFNLLYEKKEGGRKGEKENGRRGERRKGGKERGRGGRRRRVENADSVCCQLVLCLTYSIREGWFCDLIVQ